MKKWLLSFLLVCGGMEGVLMAGDYGQSRFAEQTVPELEKEGISDCDAMLDVLDTKPKEPSVLWRWFCSITSTVLVRCIRAKQYGGTLTKRLGMWWKNVRLCN